MTVVTPFGVMLLAVMSAGLQASPIAADSGERIYHTGTASAGRPVTATLGGDGTELQGAVVACVNCHGEAAEGKPDGWGSPPPLRWNLLARDLGELRADGSVRPPYDEFLFGRAVHRGIDAAGRTLDTTMPRYRLDATQIHALAEYLRRLQPVGEEADVVIGTWAEADSRSAAASEVQQGLRECLAGVPTLFGRRVRLQVFHRPTGMSMGAWAAELGKTPGLLAVVAPLVAGSETEFNAAFRRGPLPVVGPVSLLAPGVDEEDSRVFFLSGGLLDEVTVLGERLAGAVASGGTLWVFRTMDPTGDALLQRVVERMRRHSAAPPVAAVGLDRSGRRASAAEGGASPRAGDAVLLLVPPVLREPWMQAGSETLQGVTIGVPSLYLIDPGSRESAFSPAVAWASYPWIGGQAGKGSIYTRWSRIGCGLTLAALRAVGHRLSRDGLQSALESMENYSEAGVPALHFERGRHIGIRGAYLISLTRPAAGSGEWIGLEDGS